MDDDRLMQLCRNCVDAWDLETTVSYAVESLFTYYKDNPDELHDFLLSLGEIE